MIPALGMDMDSSFDGSTRQPKPDPDDPERLSLERAKRGDLCAFEGLVIRHKPMIFRIIQRITRNREDTEDQTQETFLRAYRSLSQFKGDSKFSTWLTRIAVNQALMCLRARRSTTVSLEEAFDLDGGAAPYNLVRYRRPNPEEEYMNAAVGDRLYEKISKLPCDFQSVILLRYVHEYTTEEVATLLGISLASVKTRAWRARQRLRGWLGDEIK